MVAELLAASLAGASRPDPQRFLRADAARHAVELTLVAGYDDANRGFNFDGYGRGELLVTVPRGWRVRIRCENRGPLRHSCAVVAGAMSARLAFPGAATPRPTEGLQAGAAASFSFTASRAGTFRLACLVPGHEEARMWDVLEVRQGGRPSIAARAGL